MKSTVLDNYFQKIISEYILIDKDKNGDITPENFDNYIISLRKSLIESLEDAETETETEIEGVGEDRTQNVNFTEFFAASIFTGVNVTGKGISASDIKSYWLKTMDQVILYSHSIFIMSPYEN